VSVVCNLLARRRFGRRRALAAAGVATVEAVLLVPFTDLVSVAIEVVAAAVGIGTAVPSTMAELMHRTPPRARGRNAERTAAMQATGYAHAVPNYGVLFSADPVLRVLVPVPAAAAWLILVAAEPEINTVAAKPRVATTQHSSQRWRNFREALLRAFGRPSL
jgi:MFS family permease